MPPCVAFLRAINVGGHTVTNDRLRELFAELGVDDPTPYQASGNVVLATDTADDLGPLEERIEDHLARELGYEVATFVRTLDTVAELAGARPFGTLPEGAKLHVAFLRRPPERSELADLEAVAAATDRFVVADRELLWQVGGAFMESSLSSPQFQRALGQPTTLRTQATLARIAPRFGS